MKAKAAKASSAEGSAADRRKTKDRRQGDRRAGGPVSKAQGSSVAIIQAGFILAMQFIMIVIFCS